MDGFLSRNVDIGICHTPQPQTKGPLCTGDSTMHPSVLRAAIADDSRVKDRSVVLRIHLVTGKDDGANLNSSVGCDGYGTVEIGLKTFECLPRLTAVMM